MVKLTSLVSDTPINQTCLKDPVVSKQVISKSENFSALSDFNHCQSGSSCPFIEICFFHVFGPSFIHKTDIHWRKRLQICTSGSKKTMHKLKQLWLLRKLWSYRKAIVWLGILNQSLRNLAACFHPAYPPLNVSSTCYLFMEGTWTGKDMVSVSLSIAQAKSPGTPSQKVSLTFQSNIFLEMSLVSVGGQAQFVCPQYTTRVAPGRPEPKP